MADYTVYVLDLAVPATLERQVLGDIACVRELHERDDRSFPQDFFMADAVLVWHSRLTSYSIERLSRCRAIVRYGVGYDNVDIIAAGRCGIPVCNTPDYGTEEVADTTIALILALARKIPSYQAHLLREAARWDWGAVGPLHRLRDRTLGLIGLGRIGTAVALRARAFGFRVIFYDPYKPDGSDKALGITRVSDIEALLKEAHIVSLHTPLTEETRGWVDASFLAAMRKGAMLVNTARGAIVKDLGVLAEFLRNGHLAGVALDVLPHEPMDPADPAIRAWRAGESWIRDKLIITPHAAFYSEEALEEMRRKAALAVRASLEGRPLANVVNREFLSNTLRA